MAGPRVAVDRLSKKTKPPGKVVGVVERGKELEKCLDFAAGVIGPSVLTGASARLLDWHLTRGRGQPQILTTPGRQWTNRSCNRAWAMTSAPSATAHLPERPPEIASTIERELCRGRSGRCASLRIGALLRSFAQARLRHPCCRHCRPRVRIGCRVHWSDANREPGEASGEARSSRMTPAAKSRPTFPILSAFNDADYFFRGVCFFGEPVQPQTRGRAMFDLLSINPLRRPSTCCSRHIRRRSVLSRRRRSRRPQSLLLTSALLHGFSVVCHDAISDDCPHGGCAADFRTGIRCKSTNTKKQSLMTLDISSVFLPCAKRTLMIGLFLSNR